MWVVFECIIYLKWIKGTGKAESLKMAFLPAYVPYKINELYSL